MFKGTVSDLLTSLISSENAQFALKTEKGKREKERERKK